MNKKVQQDLFPDIPTEIRAARIGTCFNSISRKLMEKKIAIDPNRLKNSAVKFVDGKGLLQLKMNSTTNATTEGTFFSLDSKIKADVYSCTATIGFKASLASQSASNSSDLNCYCSYVYSGQELRLLEVGSKELYNSMTDEFQEAYSAIITSNNVKDYLANYMNFINLFGNGCVTDLYLTSGSAFTINVNYADRAETINRKYGGNFSLSTPWSCSGSAAAEFAKDVSNTGSIATMDLLFEELPQDTPTKAWCKELMDKVSALGFEKLAQTPNAIQPYTGKGPEAPEIPEGSPTNKEEPSGKGFDIAEDLKSEIMKEDKFTGTWAEYEIAQQIAYEELEAKKIVQEVQQSSRKSSALHTQQAENIQIAAAIDMAADDPWNLGGYCPFAYKITPWSDLFPQLKDMKLPTTFTSIYIAKIYIYYFTRLQFSSYLYFLADVGPQLCQNDSISTDAEIYSKACSDFLAVVEQSIEDNKTINKAIYDELIDFFETKVANLNSFYSNNVYTIFFEQYEFFVDNSYGFIVTTTSQKYYIENGDRKNIPEPFSLVAMLKDAIRIYPVICNDGKIAMVGFDPNSWNPSNSKIIWVKKEGPAGFYYYEDGGFLRFYGVGFKDIPQDVNLPIRGLPMFNELPFEELKEFAKPKVNAGSTRIGKGVGCIRIEKKAIEGMVALKFVAGTGISDYDVFLNDERILVRLLRPGVLSNVGKNSRFIVRVSDNSPEDMVISVAWS